MRATVLALLFLAITHRSAVGQNSDLSVSDIVAQSAAAVVTIKTFDATGRPTGLGSGFRVASGRVVTNAHVIAGASRIEMFDNTEQLLGSAGFAEVVSTTVDLAILPRLGTRSAQLRMAATLPRVGERVVVIGAPEGLTNTVSDGLVSAIRSIDGRVLLQISAPISPGSSGGPVLNTRGEVIGVSVSILREGQNLNFAVPLADVLAMLASPAGRVAFPRQSVAGGRRERERPERPASVVRLGESIDGSLTADDKTLQSGKKYDVYRMQVASGTRVTVTVQSRDFDSYVLVFRWVGDSLVRVASDDDSGGGLDAKASFRAPGRGEYLIDVLSAAERGGTGEYRLTVNGGAQRSSSGAPSGSAGTGSDRWVKTAQSEGTGLFYDRTRISGLGNGMYRVWTLRVEGPPVTDSEGLTYDSAISMEEVDCRGTRTRIVELIQYMRGKVVYSSDWDEPANWSSLIPESVGERHFLSLCRYAASRGL